MKEIGKVNNVPRNFMQIYTFIDKSDEIEIKRSFPLFVSTFKKFQKKATKF